MMTSKNVTLKKAKNEQIINGLDQEIIATDAILSDLQLSKARADAEHAQQQKIAAERKREQLLKQSIADAQKRASDFHNIFNPNEPNKALVHQYINDYALLAKHGKQPQPCPSGTTAENMVAENDRAADGERRTTAIFEIETIHCHSYC
jgi:hypothetical protein